MEAAAYELYTHGYGHEALEVGKREIEWLESRSEAESNRERYLLGRAYYLTEQWQRAQEIFKELAGNNPRNIEFLGYLGSLAVRAGRRDQANQIAEALGKLEAPYLYGLHIYCRARIESLLGDKAKAVLSLQTAFSQGYRFSISVHCDPDFAPLRGYAPYEELIRPKG